MKANFECIPVHPKFCVINLIANRSKMQSVKVFFDFQRAESITLRLIKIITHKYYNYMYIFWIL